MVDSDSSQMRVVIIDDDTMVLRSLKASLSDLGYAVETFATPFKGLEWIEKNGVDIVISDICMPECDGFEVLKRVKESAPECDVLFITAHGQLDTAIRALREGATDFFEKPFTTAALHAAIERTSRFHLLSRQKAILTDKVSILNDELRYKSGLRNVMLGQSAAMKKLAEEIVDLAPSSATVLILGESGVGKELVANALHLASERHSEAFLTINCPSVPEELFESEMFGHRRGSFTGAIETRGGYVEGAEGGTLFLDEIGDLPLKSQAKILRLLEEKTYLPIGEHREKAANVRIVAATNQSLEELVKNKQFREDLYYRLSVCTMVIPPLRERKDDIPLLALYFTLRFAGEMGKQIDGIDDEAMRALCNYDFPGNIRELRNFIESSVIHCHKTGLLSKDDLPDLIRSASPRPSNGNDWPFDTLKVDDVERYLYAEALRRTDENVSAAARLLGLSRGKLRRRLGSLGISAEEE